MACEADGNLWVANRRLMAIRIPQRGTMELAVIRDKHPSSSYRTEDFLKAVKKKENDGLPTAAKIAYDLPTRYSKQKEGSTRVLIRRL